MRKKFREAESWKKMIQTEKKSLQVCLGVFRGKKYLSQQKEKKEIFVGEKLPRQGNEGGKMYHAVGENISEKRREAPSDSIN